MKKLLSLVLSILLLLTFTACGTSTRCANCQCGSCGCECTTSSDKSKENVDVSYDNENSYDSTTASSTTEPEDKLPTTSEESVTISDKEENNYSNNTNSNSTPDLSDNFKETIYNDAKQMYLSGEWDGSPTTLYGQNIEISTNSNGLLINGGILYNHYMEDWDLPENWDSLNIQAVSRSTPDIGVFAIQDNTLVRYVHVVKTLSMRVALLIGKV